MKYPHLSDELVAILELDQEEIRKHSKAYKDSPDSPSIEQNRKRLTKRSMKRAQRMLEILEYISEPSIENVGASGIEAMVVIALHSKYSIMKKVLAALEMVQKKDPVNMRPEFIPSLTDRVLMLERKKQMFGTQWLVGTDNKPFLYPVEDFKRMNERRKAYGLRKARHPRDLTYGIPKGPLPPYTQQIDQREPTEEEYIYQTSELHD